MIFSAIIICSFVAFYIYATKIAPKRRALKPKTPAQPKPKGPHLTPATPPRVASVMLALTLTELADVANPDPHIIRVAQRVYGLNDEEAKTLLDLAGWLNSQLKTQRQRVNVAMSHLRERAKRDEQTNAFRMLSGLEKAGILSVSIDQQVQLAELRRQLG